jgi:hypothetical protein
MQACPYSLKLLKARQPRALHSRWTRTGRWLWEHTPRLVRPSNHMADGEDHGFKFIWVVRVVAVSVIAPLMVEAALHLAIGLPIPQAMVRGQIQAPIILGVFGIAWYLFAQFVLRNCLELTGKQVDLLNECLDEEGREGWATEIARWHMLRPLTQGDLGVVEKAIALQEQMTIQLAVMESERLRMAAFMTGRLGAAIEQAALEQGTVSAGGKASRVGRL